LEKPQYIWTTDARGRAWFLSIELCEAVRDWPKNPKDVLTEADAGTDVLNSDNNEAEDGWKSIDERVSLYELKLKGDDPNWASPEQEQRLDSEALLCRIRPLRRTIPAAGIHIDSYLAEGGSFAVSTDDRRQEHLLYCKCVLTPDLCQAVRWRLAAVPQTVDSYTIELDYKAQLQRQLNKEPETVRFLVAALPSGTLAPIVVPVRDNETRGRNPAEPESLEYRWEFDGKPEHPESFQVATGSTSKPRYLMTIPSPAIDRVDQSDPRPIVCRWQMSEHPPTTSEILELLVEPSHAAIDAAHKRTGPADFFRFPARPNGQPSASTTSPATTILIRNHSPDKSVLAEVAVTKLFVGTSHVRQKTDAEKRKDYEAELDPLRRALRERVNEDDPGAALREAREKAGRDNPNVPPPEGGFHFVATVEGGANETYSPGSLTPTMYVTYYVLYARHETAVLTIRPTETHRVDGGSLVQLGGSLTVEIKTIKWLEPATASKFGAH